MTCDPLGFCYNLDEEIDSYGTRLSSIVLKTSYYSETAGLLIAFGLSQGLSLRQIAELWIPRHRPGLSRWKHENPDFAELVDLGMRARTSELAREELMCQLEKLAPGAIAASERAPRKRRATKRAKR